MKLFLKDSDIDWEKVRERTHKLAELDAFLRLNEKGSLLRAETISELKTIFRPLIFGIANTPREFKVYARPLQELLEVELLASLKIALKTSSDLSIEWLQQRLIESIDNEYMDEVSSESLETSNPIFFSEESWRLIHLENGLFEVEEIENFLKRIFSSKLLTAAQEVSIAMDIEAGQFAQEKLNHRSGLSDIERRELDTLVANGQIAFDQLFESSLSQLLTFAVYYRGRGLTILELIQEGSIGLIRAIQKFDVDKGYRLSTYATWWIRQSMTRAIADSNSLIRVPVHRHEEIRKVLEIFEDLGIEDASQVLEPWELAYILNELETDEKSYRQLLKSIWKIDSIQKILDKDGEISEDIFEQNGYDFSANNPYDFYVLEEFEMQTKYVLYSITDRESLVIQLRYGFDGFLRTLQEIGEVLNLTRERIRQIESKTMSKLRHPSRSEALKDYLDIDVWPETFQKNFIKSSVFLLPKEKLD